MKGWVESGSTLCVGKNTGSCVQYFLTVVLLTFCTCCILRCLVCIVVSCLVCIIAIVLCVLLLFVLCVLLLVVLCVMLLVFLCVLLSSYVYLLYYVCIAVFYFRCPTAGYKSVFGRSCNRPPRHRFFLVSLCTISKCWDGSQDSKLPLYASHVAYRLKFISNQFPILYTSASVV